MSEVDHSDGIAETTFRPFRRDDPLLNALGETEIAADAAGVRLRVLPSPAAANAVGILHGGSLSAWLDVAMYEAACAVAPDSHCLTATLQTQFLRSAKRDGAIVVRGAVIKAGRQSIFAEGAVDQGGRRIATATALFQRVPI